MLRLHSSGILFDRKIRLNNLVSQTIVMSLRLLHTSIGILFRPIVFPPFILFKASLTSDSWILRTNCLMRSSEEMPNSMDELPLSSLKSLSKYSGHLFLISSSLVRSRSVAFLMHFTWMMPLVFLSRFWPSYRCPPSFVPNRWNSPSYIWPLASLTARFAVFFDTLYRSMLSTLLSRCIRLKHSFFSLIAFCTFSFHHHVSLVSRLPPLVTPNFSEATFLMQVAIFIHMLFTSPPSCQGPSLRTLSSNVFAASSLSFHHFVHGAWTRLLHWRWTQKRRSASTSLCWGTTYSPSITLQSKQAFLSSLLTRMKSIWLQYW
jgi:hypothetical protein